MTRTGRPTIYRGIQMRSRLEADYAASLDQTGDAWEYEPQCFAGPDGQWLPDFRVGKPGDYIYIELKPTSILQEGSYNAVDKILHQMEIALLSEPKCSLRLQFWEWGKASGRAAIWSDPPHSLWQYSAGTGLPWGIWPGMCQLEKVYDHDLSAERSLLQGMLLSADVCRSVASRVTAGDYWRPSHQILHWVITDLALRNIPSDPVSVANELTRRGDLARAGGVKYLQELIGLELPKNRNYDDYAHAVISWADLRRTFLTEHNFR